MDTCFICGFFFNFSSNLFNIAWFKFQHPEAERDTFSILVSSINPLASSSRPLSDIFLQLNRFRNIFSNELIPLNANPNAFKPSSEIFIQKENSNYKYFNNPSLASPSQISPNPIYVIFSHFTNSRVRLLRSFSFFKQSFIEFRSLSDIPSMYGKHSRRYWRDSRLCKLWLRLNRRIFPPSWFSLKFISRCFNEISLEIALLKWSNPLFLIFLLLQNPQKNQK